MSQFTRKYYDRLGRECVMQLDDGGMPVQELSASDARAVQAGEAAVANSSADPREHVNVAPPKSADVPISSDPYVAAQQRTGTMTLEGVRAAERSSAEFNQSFVTHGSRR